MKNRTGFVVVWCGIIPRQRRHIHPLLQNWIFLGDLAAYD